MNQLEHILWDEWTSFPVVAPAEDEISGIIDGLNYETSEDKYIFNCSRLFNIRRLMKLWAESKYQTEEVLSQDTIRLIHSQRKGKNSFYLNSDTAQKILNHSSKFGRRVRNWNWIRGLWGSCGSLYLPKTGYYLIIRPPFANGSAERLQSILRSAGFPIGIRKKTSGKEIIMRDQQQIVTFLSRLGFIQTTLSLEETAIYRSVRNQANKLCNCDTANINKTLAAAQSQLAVIAEIENLGIIDEVPDVLRELVFARKANPSISLKELGQSLPRPISKSTVEYRWRKLENLLHRHLKGDGGHVPWKGRC